MSATSRVKFMPKPHRNTFDPDPQQEHEADVGSLVRDIVQRVSPRPSNVGQDQQVLAETTIDGARYLLVRIPKAEEPAVALSPREAEIVRMVSRGLPNKVIADLLNISSWTVSTHLRRIFAKLGVSSRAAIVAHTLQVHSTQKPRSS